MFPSSCPGPFVTHLLVSLPPSALQALALRSSGWAILLWSALLTEPWSSPQTCSTLSSLIHQSPTPMVARNGCLVSVWLIFSDPSLLPFWDVLPTFLHMSEFKVLAFYWVRYAGWWRRWWGRLSEYRWGAIDRPCGHIDFPSLVPNGFLSKGRLNSLRIEESWLTLERYWKGPVSKRGFVLTDHSCLVQWAVQSCIGGLFPGNEFKKTERPQEELIIKAHGS